jgi:hypothetical protein
LELIFRIFFHTYALFREAVKKLIAILLVVLLLFNALGFYGLLEGLRYKTTLELVRRLDKNQYTQDEIVILKVPFAIPYQLNSSDYERVDGEMEYDGEFYRLVSQKLTNDTLFMACIKDHSSNRIHKALADYVKTFTDKPAQNKNSKGFLSFIKDFLPTIIEISSASEGWNFAFLAAPAKDHFPNRSLLVFTPPPQS